MKASTLLFNSEGPGALLVFFVLRALVDYISDSQGLPFPIDVMGSLTKTSWSCMHSSLVRENRYR